MYIHSIQCKLYSCLNEDVRVLSIAMDDSNRCTQLIIVIGNISDISMVSEHVLAGSLTHDVLPFDLQSTHYSFTLMQFL